MVDESVPSITSMKLIRRMITLDLVLAFAMVGVGGSGTMKWRWRRHLAACSCTVWVSEGGVLSLALGLRWWTAIGFCPFVDGTGIFPKLPTHMRTHKDQWERNQRVKESVRRVQGKNDTLLALNERIVPRCEGKETNKPIEDNGDGPIIKLQQCLPLLHVPPRKQILPG